MRQGLARYKLTGAQAAVSYYQALLAEACGKGGQSDEGLRVVAEALVFMQQTANRVYEAELYRVQGELLRVQQSTGQPAEGTRQTQSEMAESFLQALGIARHQQAKLLELRAAMSLSQLWQQQGKWADARALLAEVYGWFTEGFDTADLQEAKALLDALA
jgi:predicted ATPase